MNFWPFKKTAEITSPANGPMPSLDGEYIGNRPGRRLVATVHYDGLQWTTQSMGKEKKEKDNLTIFLYKYDDGRRSFTWMARLDNFYNNPRWLGEYVKGILIWAEGGPMPPEAKLIDRATSPTTQPWHYDG